MEGRGYYCCMVCMPVCLYMYVYFLLYEFQLHKSHLSFAIFRYKNLETKSILISRVDGFSYRHEISSIKDRRERGMCGIVNTKGKKYGKGGG